MLRRRTRVAGLSAERASSTAEPGAVRESRNRREKVVLKTRFPDHKERIHGAHGRRMQSLFIISQTCWKSRDRYRCRARTARRSCEFLAPVHAKGRKEPTRPFFFLNHFKDRRGYLWWSFPLLHVKVLQGSQSPVSAVVTVPEWPADGAYPPAARRVLAPFLEPTLSRRCCGSSPSEPIGHVSYSRAVDLKHAWSPEGVVARGRGK